MKNTIKYFIAAGVMSCLSFTACQTNDDSHDFDNKVFITAGQFNEQVLVQTDEGVTVLTTGFQVGLAEPESQDVEVSFRSAPDLLDKYRLAYYDEAAELLPEGHCNAPQLRAVAKYGVGLDNIDLAACEARGIRVSRTLGAPTEAVADYTLALMLAVARKVPLIDARCRHKDWSKITGTDLFGATLGIIGLGSIGKAVVRRARGFSMKVLAHDLCWDDAYAAENGIERADVERICRESDFISLHTVLDDSTRHMINAERLAMMKPTAILINTARGGLIDGAALLAALKEGHIYGAGLDVFEEEPPAEEGWYTLDNLVMGSHCSSSTPGSSNTMGRMAVDNLLKDLGLA